MSVSLLSQCSHPDPTLSGQGWEEGSGVSDCQAAWDGLTCGAPEGWQLVGGRRDSRPWEAGPGQVELGPWALVPVQPTHGEAGTGAGCGKDQCPVALPPPSREEAQRLDLTELA